MVLKIPLGPLKTEAETETYKELKQKSTVFFHTPSTKLLEGNTSSYVCLFRGSLNRALALVPLYKDPVLAHPQTRTLSWPLL